MASGMDLHDPDDVDNTHLSGAFDSQMLLANQFGEQSFTFSESDAQGNLLLETAQAFDADSQNFVSTWASLLDDESKLKVLLHNINRDAERVTFTRFVTAAIDNQVPFSQVPDSAETLFCAFAHHVLSWNEVDADALTAAIQWASSQEFAACVEELYNRFCPDDLELVTGKQCPSGWELCRALSQFHGQSLQDLIKHCVDDAKKHGDTGHEWDKLLHAEKRKTNKNSLLTSASSLLVLARACQTKLL